MDYIINFIETGIKPTYNNGSNIALDFIDTGFMPVINGRLNYLSSADSILLSDSVIKNIQPNKNEPFGLVDALGSSLSRAPMHDNISLLDSVGKNISIKIPKDKKLCWNEITMQWEDEDI